MGTSRKRLAPDSKALEALKRVLEHAEQQGEVYVGAIEDHKAIRDAITSGALVK